MSLLPASRLLSIFLLAGLLLAAPARAQEKLTLEELRELVPGADVDAWTPEQVEQQSTNPMLLKLRERLRAAQRAREANERAKAEGAPGRVDMKTAAPSFDDLAGPAAEAAPELGNELTEEQLREAAGEYYDRMGPNKRRRALRNSSVLTFYRGYLQGRFTLEQLNQHVKNLLSYERPPLVTSAGKPLRDQLPKESRYFVLDLNWSTGRFFIEGSRTEKSRDQQVANVWAALVDEDGESDVEELLRRIAMHGKSAGETPDKVQILLNLKLAWRGTIGANDTFGLISIGMENPWMSPGMDIRSLRGVVAHELGHMLQNELYGWKPSVGFLARFEGFRHNPEVATNSSLAFSEGFADYCGVSFGKSDYWDWSPTYLHQKGDGKKPHKSRKDKLDTEGVVTKILLTAEERIPAFRTKLLRSMQKHRPTSIEATIDGYAEDYPADARALSQLREDVLAGR